MEPATVVDQRVAPDTVLTFRAWVDPTVDRIGADTTSIYVERFWLPIMGPTAILLLRYVGRELSKSEELSVTFGELAATIGVSKEAALVKALRRLVKFRIMLADGDRYRCRLKLAPLSKQQVYRLPDGLRALHDQLVTDVMRRAGTRP